MGVLKDGNNMAVMSSCSWEQAVLPSLCCRNVHLQGSWGQREDELCWGKEHPQGWATALLARMGGQWAAPHPGGCPYTVSCWVGPVCCGVLEQSAKLMEGLGNLQGVQQYSTSLPSSLLLVLLLFLLPSVWDQLWECFPKALFVLCFIFAIALRMLWLGRDL